MRGLGYISWLVYGRATQLSILMIVGPVGTYILYQLAFVLRFALQSTYPALAPYIAPSGLILEAALCAIACALSVWVARTRKYPQNTNIHLPTFALVLLTITTAALMVATVYRTFGILDLNLLAKQYDHYYQFSRNGGAWMILVGYGIVYILLIDMFRGGVNAINSMFLFVNIALNFTTGGRQLLMVCLVAYLFLLYFQRPKLGLNMLISLGLTAIVMMGAGYKLASKIRGASEIVVEYVPPTKEPVKPHELTPITPDAPPDVTPIVPTETYYTLNFNAAFILNDVIRELEDGKVLPAPHVLIDAMNLVPRFIKPSKLPSNSTTRSFYPEKGATGTTLSFPLKANLIAHFGLWAYFFDWAVVGAMQAAFIWGLFTRKLGPLSFIVFFWGAAFSLIARDGILNVGNLVQTAVILAAYLCYTILVAVVRPLSLGSVSDQAT